MGNARTEQMTSRLATGDFPGAAPRLLQPDSVCDPLRTPAQAAPGKGSPGRQTRRKPRRELAGTMNGRKRSSLSWKTAFSTALFQGTILQRALMSDHSFCVVLSVTGKSKIRLAQKAFWTLPFPSFQGKHPGTALPGRCFATWAAQGMLPGPGHGQKGREGRAGGGPGARPGRGAACAAPQRPPPALQPRAPPAAPRPPGGATKEGAGRGGGRRGRGARESCRGAQRGGGGRAEQGEVLAQLRAGSRGSEVPTVR